MFGLLSQSVCACALLFLTGCVKPTVSSVNLGENAPAAWVSQSMEEGEQLVAAELAVWWTVYDDEALTSLVQRSLDANLNLQAALERIEESAALRGVAAGERLPAMNASGAVQETRLSDAQGGATGERSFTLTSAGLDASWELDLFGRVRNSVRAADAGLRGTIEDARAVRALVAAQVVDGVITLREVRLRLRLAEENAARQRETLRLTQGRYENGLVPQLDVHQAELNLSRTEAVIPVLRQREQAAVRGLEVLAGLPPGGLMEELVPVREVPLPEEVALNDWPVNVLRRRPDVRSAEQRLLAAAAQVGVARASLYPRISLSGQFAWQAREAGDLFDSGSLGYGIGPRIVWPFFQGGRLRAQLDAAESRAVQAELAYRQTALEALAEVENALTAFREEQVRREKLSAGVEAAEITVKQVRSLYENGLVTFLNVLDAERNLAAVQDEAAGSLGQTARNLSAVYRAMGGGWDAPVFEAPMSAVPEERVVWSIQTSELVRMDTEAPRFRITGLEAYTRLDDGAPLLEEEITFAELPPELADLNPGERVRVRWTREQVRTGDAVEVRHLPTEATPLSTPSP
jgi:NodT family efflux transporter outer membrane factor (OMF) lipoprotein